jgi:prepilin-type N-terminal cleavage/methylation domain-containing protein
MNKRHAFTLIEMLVVIAIIGIVAALVVSMNSAAQANKRNAQVNIDKSSLISMINDYQAKLNFFPPDNGYLISNSMANYAANYDGWAATNPLIYELTGSTNTATNTIMLFDGTNIAVGTFQSYYGGRSAVANANQDEPHNFFQTGPQPKEYTNYAGSTLKGLVVPAPLVDALGNPIANNFWHYDASSTNRHNLQSYDLWAEYVIGTKGGSPIFTTNGNWK